jgi:hypothetical protein
MKLQAESSESRPTNRIGNPVRNEFLLTFQGQHAFFCKIKLNFFSHVKAYATGNDNYMFWLIGI